MRILLVCAITIALMGYVSCQPLVVSEIPEDCSLEISHNTENLFATYPTHIYYDFNRETYTYTYLTFSILPIANLSFSR